MNDTWVATKQACEFYGVSGNTIRRWGDEGRIECKRIPSGLRRFLIHPYGSSPVKNEPKKQCFVYARVSSHKQKADLERQVKYLLDKYSDYIVVKDIGSGLNNKRRGFLKLLEQSNRGEVKEIVVSSKDRMSRFGFDLVEWLFLQNNTKLVVLDNDDKSPEQELTEDILSVLQVFACRHFGKRKYTINRNQKNQVEAVFCPEKEIKRMESPVQSHVQ